MAKRSTYPEVILNKDGWSEWMDVTSGLRIACCGCGLIHDYQFNLQMRVSRNERATVQYRKAHGLPKDDQTKKV